MPPVQTTYSRTPAAAMAGLLYDLRDNVIESYATEGADGIGFGLAVIAGTDVDKQVKLPAAAGGVFRGVSVHEYAQEQQADGTVEYADKDTMNVLRRGAIWVQTNTSVDTDDDAFFVNSGADAGKFSDVDDATTDAVPTGKFRTSTTGSGLAVLEINLPA